jgi:hypothetical protein
MSDAVDLRPYVQVEGQPVYAAVMRMVEHPWHGAVHVYDDGQASIQRNRAAPGKPLSIHVEGVTPNVAQIKTLRLIWRCLSGNFNFSVVAFDEALLPYADVIRDSQ